MMPLIRQIRPLRWLTIAALALLAGCMDTGTVPTSNTPNQTPATKPAMAAVAAPSPNAAKARQFLAVVKTVEPVAEAECRARAPRANCDFRIVVDDRPGQVANAFQTLDNAGRPIIAFTLPMIAEVRNADELAFVMGHETAHHIQGHLSRQRENAQSSAIIFAGIAALTGGDASTVRSASRWGAEFGARSYSKDFELEADALGTVITQRAGYDPIRGAAFFTRIPDPGNRFLGTHPPNAQRIETVRRVAARGL